MELLETNEVMAEEAGSRLRPADMPVSRLRGPRQARPEAPPERPEVVRECFWERSL